MNRVFVNISLSNRCMQTILGGLLGDGSLKIQKNYRNARYQKFALFYKDFDYQKRWICTMKQKMPEKMHKYIDFYYTIP